MRHGVFFYSCKLTSPWSGLGRLAFVWLVLPSVTFAQAQPLDVLPPHAPEAPAWAATLELPGPSLRPPPAWLGEAQFRRQGGLLTADIPVAPVEAGRDLAVTLYYRGMSGGVARAWWQDNQGSEMVASSLDLFEGLPGQTTLMIPGALMRSSGVLVLQTSGTPMPIFRARMEWVVPREVLAAPDAPAPALFQTAVPSRDAEELRGDPPPAADVWQGSVVTAPVTEGVVTASNNIESIVTLQTVPARARLRVRVAGLAAGTTLSVRVNGAAWIPLALQVPELFDPGWFQDSAGEWRYAGWREATGWLPVAGLHLGDNALTLESSAPVPEPFAITHMELQLHYPSTLEAASPRSPSSSNPAHFAPMPIQDAEAEPPASDQAPSDDDLPMP